MRRDTGGERPFPQGMPVDIRPLWVVERLNGLKHTSFNRLRMVGLLGLPIRINIVFGMGYR